MILAPVAREKKGEFAELFAEMQAQGYVRFRLNGEVVEAEALPALKKTEKHNIDVVIDRIKVRSAEEEETHPQRQRLAESFEAALRLTEGRALTVDMDSGAEQRWQRRRVGTLSVVRLRGLTGSCRVMFAKADIVQF